MQIDIDFDVFKSLTALRVTESDSYNCVIRRLIGLPAPDAYFDQSQNALLNPMPSQVNALAGFVRSSKATPVASQNALLGALGGVWLGNTHFPEGTLFRATYKGKTYSASVKDGRWIDADGVARTSPSEAASAISGTNVNGWRFWFAKRPSDSEWHRLDLFKQ